MQCMRDGLASRCEAEDELVHAEQVRSQRVAHKQDEQRECSTQQDRADGNRPNLALRSRQQLPLLGPCDLWWMYDPTVEFVLR